MEQTITTDDQRWIDAASSDLLKEARKNALLNLIEMNGMKFEPGIGKSYILQKNYYQMVIDPDQSMAVNQLAQDALNWDALGKGTGGLAGAGVRSGLQKLFVLERETVVHRKITNAIGDLMVEFSEFSAAKKDIFPFWRAQANNVLGLAGAIFNREMHHWNSDNTRPQQALLGSLGQKDIIPENEYRKLFYLSIHPIPLDIMEDLRSRIANGKEPGINDSVASRCRSAPAGFGDVHACAQAIHDLRAEPAYVHFGERLKEEVGALYDLNEAVLTDASVYHSFAPVYKKTRRVVDKGKVKRAMVVLCAYIMINVKGTLSSSAALRKFKTSHSRSIERWMAAFEAGAQANNQTLAQLSAD